MQTLDKIAANPSGWDSAKNYIGTPLDTLANWSVVMTRNRDSDFLTQHNWDEAVALLGGESEEVAIHRFGHWACGWWEALCVKGEKQEKGQEIVEQLESYPILNEDTFSEKEYEAAQEYWAGLSVKERVALCQEADVNIFAARHEWIPQEDTGYIFERCRPMAC